MIIDDVTIIIKAGNGGNGHISFRKEKYVPRGGPDGGNGGDGGDVFFKGVSDLSALRKFRSTKEIKGNSGVHGKNKKCWGKNGEDITIRVPIGTMITDVETQRTEEVLSVGQIICIARGGKGGKGNWEFRSNENKAPRIAEDGEEGEIKKLHLNLQYIADIGFIGLPNAGKSSLLNKLTEAHAMVGAYPFTTLEANLGSLREKIIADIPGLIKGAHTGKGLGDRFLKHISKTKLLVHCIDISSKTIEKDYEIIRTELDKYDHSLVEKSEIVILTKTDLIKQDEIQKKSIIDTKKGFGSNILFNI